MRSGLALWIRRPLLRALLAPVAVAALAMCDYGDVVVVQPAAKGSGALVLSIQVDGEDAAVASQLGWTAGIPGAAVTIASGGGDTAVGAPLATLVADSEGQVSVPDLPDGKYFVQVHRLLSDAEMARLAPGEDVVGFMTQTVVNRGSVMLPVPASHRHSIVISEWSFYAETIPNTDHWQYGGYLELANNSDTTVYLDGLLIGLGHPVVLAAAWTSCEEAEVVDNDRDGVWISLSDSLPGTGRDHPLAPGAVALMATDGIDHSTVTPEGLDLSHATFEFVGTIDADNPAVPNTIHLGPREDPFGHGLILDWLTSTLVVVALPVDTAALAKREWGSFPAWRIPRARVLDVFTVFWPGATAFGSLCPILVNASFDRRPAPFDGVRMDNGSAGRWSVQRKVAVVQAGGRKILQHTRTTDADFFLGLRTPFQLP